MEFDPIRDVENAADVLDAGGWPNFHDAVVNAIALDRGDIRPEAGVWTGARVEVCLTLAALARPFDIALVFTDCDEVEIRGFDQSAEIDDLDFAFEPRGMLNDGVTPMIPAIRVRFRPFASHPRFALTLRCFGVRARRLPGQPRV